MSLAYSLEKKDTTKYTVELFVSSNARGYCADFSHNGLIVINKDGQLDIRTDDESIVKHSSSNFSGQTLHLHLTPKLFEQLEEFLVALQTHLNRDTGRWQTPAGIPASKYTLIYRFEKRGGLEIDFRIRFPAAILKWMVSQKKYSFTTKNGTVLAIPDELGGLAVRKGIWDLENRPPRIINLKIGINRVYHVNEKDTELIIEALKELQQAYRDASCSKLMRMTRREWSGLKCR